jgi:hypothetical protein
MSYELAAEIRAAGDPIPTNVVNGLASQVAEISGQKLPSTLGLKRTFIANWYAENGASAVRQASHRSNGSVGS